MANVRPVVVIGARHGEMSSGDSLEVVGVSVIINKTTSGAKVLIQENGTDKCSLFWNGTDVILLTEAGALILGSAGFERWRITTAGKLLAADVGGLVCANAALGTGATTGFLYIPTCAGTPTGTPSTETGTVPMIYDTTNNKLYVYNGAWKSVTLT